MITWVTVWFMVVSTDYKYNWGTAYTIPYATQEICLKQAKKIKLEDDDNHVVCKFGQMPVYKDK